MQVMLSAFVAAVLIAFASEAILKKGGFSSAERTASQDVRLD